MEVLLNVYDVTSTPGDPKSTVVRLNNLTRAAAVGGVFHGAVQIGSVEFSYGFCERGSGVYAVEARQNPMYQYRETISLGPTPKSMEEVKGIIRDMKAFWPGFSYDLLNRNCCHFCEELARKLEVQPVPGWLNRFAAAAATTMAVTQETVRTMHDIGHELGRLSGESLAFMRTTWQKTVAAATQQQQQLAQRLHQQRITPRSAGADAAATAGLAAHPAPAAEITCPGQLDQSSSSELVYDHPADYYGQQRTISSTSNTHSSSNQLARPADGSYLASSAAAAGQSLLTGMQQAGQHLKATTSRLGQQLQQQMMKGNAAEQQSWQQALSPAAETAAAAATDAEGSHGSAQQQPVTNSEQLQEEDKEQAGPLHQGLLPGAQPKLADQFCVSSRSIGHEDDPFAALLDGECENGGGRDDRQQQHHPKQQGTADLLL